MGNLCRSCCGKVAEDVEYCTLSEASEDQSWFHAPQVYSDSLDNINKWSPDPTPAVGSGEDGVGQVAYLPYNIALASSVPAPAAGAEIEVHREAEKNIEAAASELEDLYEDAAGVVASICSGAEQVVAAIDAWTIGTSTQITVTKFRVDIKSS